MSLQILIVDDDPDDLELLEEAILELEPASRIDKATGGKAAIEYLDNYNDSRLPNLIILDYNMPEVNGSAVLEHISAQDRYRQVPRIVFSTSDAPLHKKDCLTRGATEYFVKPTTKKQLDLIAKKMLSFLPGISH